MKRYFILIAAVVFQLCLGGIYAWSYFVPRLEETFGIPAGRAQQIFGVCIFVFTVSMIAGGRLQRRYGPRRVAMTSALCYACGYLGAGFWAVEFWHFLAFKGVLEGVGIGLGYVCPLTTALKWFPRRKGMVTGLVVGGFGGGAIALSSAAHSLFGYGWQLSQVFVLLGAGYLVVAGLSAAMLSWPREEESGKGSGAHASSPGLSHLLCDNRFWTLTMAMFAGTFGGLLIIGSLNPIGLEGGIAGAHAVLAISVFSVGNSIGRLVWGVLIDRFGKITIPVSLFLLAFAVAALLPGRAVGPSAFILTAGLIGFSFGACFVLYATQTSIVFGPERVGIVYPFIFLVGYGVPGIFGPGVGGALYQLVGNYSFSIIAAAGLAAVGGVVAVASLINS